MKPKIGPITRDELIEVSHRLNAAAAALQAHVQAMRDAGIPLIPNARYCDVYAKTVTTIENFVLALGPQVLIAREESIPTKMGMEPKAVAMNRNGSQRIGERKTAKPSRK